MAVAFAFLFAVYFLYPLDLAGPGKTIAGWAWLGCNKLNGFLHGRLVPFIFPILVWVAWQRSKGMLMRPSSWGFLWLGIGLFLFLVSLRLGQPRWALVGAPFVVVGFTYYLVGWEITKSMIFPAFFLWFAIPIPGIESYMAGYPRVLTSDLSYRVGAFLGMGVIGGANVPFAVG